jgi:hypothetical protein
MQRFGAIDKRRGVAKRISTIGNRDILRRAICTLSTPTRAR